MSTIKIYSLMQKFDDETYRTINVMLKYSETEAQNEFENLILSLRREKSDLPVNDLFLVYAGTLELATSTLIPSSVSFEERVICGALELYTDDPEGDEIQNDVPECL